MVLAWTRDDWWRGQTRGWRTHTQTDTHRQADAGNDNTRRPIPYRLKIIYTLAMVGLFSTMFTARCASESTHWLNLIKFEFNHDSRKFIVDWLLTHVKAGLSSHQNYRRRISSPLLLMRNGVMCFNPLSFILPLKANKFPTMYHSNAVNEEYILHRHIVFPYSVKIFASD